MLLLSSWSCIKFVCDIAKITEMLELQSISRDPSDAFQVFFIQIFLICVKLVGDVAKITERLELQSISWDPSDASKFL